MGQDCGFAPQDRSRVFRSRPKYHLANRKGRFANLQERLAAHPPEIDPYGVKQ